jgi:hypothetical protein
MRDNTHLSSLTPYSYPRKEASIIIDLYSIFYPENPRIVLRFGGVFNFNKLETYLVELLAEAADEYIGCRIDAFQYDTKKVSKEDDLWFFFETDWRGPIRVHCSKMSMTVVEQ